MRSLFKETFYPFTTENIAGYMPNLNIKNKSVLTLGSSGDQVLNAILLGAEHITLFDINPNALQFFLYKKSVILKHSRSELYKRILDTKRFNYFSGPTPEIKLQKDNLYMKNDELYDMLREKLINFNNIDFINGDIFSEKLSIIKGTYDRIFLSNVLDYIDLNSLGITGRKIYGIYERLCNNLNDSGIIQLFYLYNSFHTVELIETIKVFFEKNLILEELKCESSNDSVVLVKKLKK